VAAAFDASDPFSRIPRTGESAAPWSGGPFRFGVPPAAQREFFGDSEAALLYEQAIQKFESLGGLRVEIDFAPFRAAAELLYAGPWVAERLAAIGPFLDAHPDQVNPVVREIISGGRRYTAVGAFQAEYRLRALRRETESQWEQMDILVLPTTGTIYTHEQIAADPIGLNSNLGYYTNFANLLDLAVVAAPAAFRSNGTPFGVSLIGPAFSDEALLAVADRYHAAHTFRPGPAIDLCSTPPDCVAVAVVGAHLTGQPLNRQLTELGARRLKSCRTAAGYRLYALEHLTPPKPGLVRDDGFAGPGIEVEVWAVPLDRFGLFVAAIPAPLGIGTAILDSGESVKCFLCEPYALQGATEITQFGGWRAYLTQAVHAR
jgi:allophanate hydrolase